MISPGQYNIDDLISGSDWNMIVTLQDSDGVPIDLTDYQFSASIWNHQKTMQYAEMLVSVIDAEAGTIELSLGRETTALLPSTNGDIGFWDLLVTQANGEEYYWLRGDVAVRMGGSANDVQQ